MPHVIHCDDSASYSLAEACDHLDSMSFDCNDEDSLSHAVLALKRLANNRHFLGDLLVGQLTSDGGRSTGFSAAYSPQAIVLSNQRNGYFLRANIWPAERDGIFAASAARTFVYGVPHDHNFNFLTVGYFGPGYRSAYYEYDHSSVVGYVGERPGLRFIELSALAEGKLQLYRAHRDIHEQIPPECMSVSLNVVEANEMSCWHDQYGFDLDDGSITGLINPNGTEAFLKIAVSLGGEEALCLAERFGRTHPSHRIRLASYDARAGALTDRAARDAVWAEAERVSGSLRVRHEAAARRRALERHPRSEA